MSKGLERALKVVADENGDLLKYKKALEIIKEKQVNVSALLTLDDFAEYNQYCSVVGGCKKLTIEEYDLLKEVLL